MAGLVAKMREIITPMEVADTPALPVPRAPLPRFCTFEDILDFEKIRINGQFLHGGSNIGHSGWPEWTGEWIMSDWLLIRRWTSGRGEWMSNYRAFRERIRSVRLAPLDMAAMRDFLEHMEPAHGVLAKASPLHCLAYLEGRKAFLVRASVVDMGNGSTGASDFFDEMWRAGYMDATAHAVRGETMLPEGVVEVLFRIPLE